MAPLTDRFGPPDYAPVTKSVLGPAVNERGYYVGTMYLLESLRLDVSVRSQVHA